MMIRKTMTGITLSLAITGAAHALSPEDREIADEFLKMPQTIGFIEADEDLRKLSPEEMYDRLKKDGVIDGIRKDKAEQKWMKDHPDYDLLQDAQKKSIEDLIGNKVQMPACVAKRKGTFLTYQGPPSIQPWASIFPLMKCVDAAQNQGADPHKCIIAGCTPMYGMPSATTVAEMVRDILLGRYN